MPGLNVLSGGIDLVEAGYALVLAYGVVFQPCTVEVIVSISSEIMTCTAPVPATRRPRRLPGKGRHMGGHPVVLLARERTGAPPMWLVIHLAIFSRFRPEEPSPQPSCAAIVSPPASALSSRTFSPTGRGNPSNQEGREERGRRKVCSDPCRWCIRPCWPPGPRTAL